MQGNFSQEVWALLAAPDSVEWLDGIGWGHRDYLRLVLSLLQGVCIVGLASRMEPSTYLGPELLIVINRCFVILYPSIPVDIARILWPSRLPLPWFDFHRAEVTKSWQIL